MSLLAEAGFRQRLAGGLFQLSHSDDKVSQIAELKRGAEKSEKKKNPKKRAPSRLLNVANRRVKPAVTNRPTLGLYWTISGSHP